ncbi:MAG: acyl carrier protein [Proteobacteria bacterium]|nr:acyl carrier protein [Pseudomonadota bacterium]MBU1741682.1 acyl carrier protein [Pseudomonadota bacterium]
MTPREVVFAFFKDRGGLPGENAEQKLACRFLDVGLLDSLGLVELITEIEDRFSITLTDDHTESEQFQTVGGLVDLIEELRLGSGARP